jgi:hypothetical protein
MSPHRHPRDANEATHTNASANSPLVPPSVLEAAATPPLLTPMRDLAEAHQEVDGPGPSTQRDAGKT